MSIVNVADLKSNMVLADDVKARNGRFLLARGTVLTPKHLEILKMWGVIEADIVTEESPEEAAPARPPSPSAALVQEAEADIRPRFLHADLEHPVNAMLLRIAAIRRVARPEKKAPPRATAPPAPDLPERSTPPSFNPSAVVNAEELTLSTLPVIIFEINEVISNPKSSSKDIAQVIQKDPSLSVRLLRIVNSAFYGFPSKVETLSRAVAVLGTKQLSMLAVGVQIVNTFRNIPGQLIDMQSFLTHSIACGVLARIFAGQKNIQNSERLFVGGLLHDIGRLVLYNHTPEMARDALLRARQARELLFRMENDTLNCDHAQMGGLLLKRWRLPLSLENMVAYHHVPMQSRDPLEPSIIHVADIVANAFAIGSSGEWLVPPLEPAAWDFLGLSPNVLALVTKQMDRQCDEFFRFLLSD